MVDHRRVHENAELVPVRDNTVQIGGLLVDHQEEDPTRKTGTGRKWETELYDQVEFQRTLLEAMSDAGVQLMVIESGRIIHVGNRKIARQFGFTDAEIDAHPSLFDIVHPDDRAWVAENHQRRLADDSAPISYELGLITRAGERREYLISVAVVPGTDPVRVVSIGVDITERKKAEEALRESEAFLNVLLNAIPIPVFYKDREGRYAGFNQAFETFFGSTKGELVGKSVFDINPVELAEIYHAKDTELFEKGGIQEYESQVKDAQGALRDVIFHKAGFTDRQGAVSGLIGAILDITERKRIELALRESEQKFAAAFHQSPVALSITSVSNLRFLDVNEQFSKYTGYAREEIIGKLSSDLDLWVSSEDRNSFLYRIQEHGAVTDFAFPYRCKDGTIRSALASATLINAGAEHYILAQIIDFTERKQMEELLRTREREYRTLAEDSSDVIVRYDRNCRRVYINPAWERVNGVPAEEALGKTPSQFSAKIAASAQTFERRLKDVILTGLPGEIELTWVERSGEMVFFSLQAIPEFGQDGSVVSVLTVSRDVTSSRRLEEELFRREAELRTLLENTPDTVARYDLDCRRVFANSAFSRLAGIPEKQLLGKRPTDYNPGPAAALYEARIHEVLRTGREAQIEYTWPDRDKRMITSQIRMVPEFDSSGSIVSVLATGRDITAMKEAEGMVEFLAHHDALTGLPNRLLTEKRVEQAIALANHRGGRFALLFVDLDHFKAVNDSMGHAVGDALLQRVALRLKQIVGDSHIVGRQGGDEFLILLNDLLETHAATNMAVKIAREFDQEFHVDGHSLSVSMSIGIALYPDDGDSFSVLLQRADSAMYSAKSRGRNTHSFFEIPVAKRSFERIQMQGDLRRAIQNREFQVHYQPRIDLRTGLVSGAEALLRWNHPELGFIPPETFIPLAEAGGMIQSIDLWVLHEACRQTAEWFRQGLSRFVLSVNISGIEFRRFGLYDGIATALAESHLNPECLELEITESELIRDSAQATKMMRKIESIGVKFAIDDFGTGYSSLTYLKQFRVHKLKIDRSFVKDLDTNVENATIVRSVVQIAKALHMKTVAEGIESQGVLDILRSMDCDEAQGFHLAKPMPPDEIGTYLRLRTAKTGGA